MSYYVCHFSRHEILIEIQCLIWFYDTLELKIDRKVVANRMKRHWQHETKVKINRIFSSLIFPVLFIYFFNYYFKGTHMGLLLHFVCPSWNETEIVTCKILCTLHNFLLKNVIVFFFGNQISKWRTFEKRAIFDLLFTFLVTREKTEKFHQHISHLHTYTYFAHPIDFLCLINFAKITNLSCMVSLCALLGLNYSQA